MNIINTTEKVMVKQEAKYNIGQKDFYKVLSDALNYLGHFNPDRVNPEFFGLRHSVNGSIPYILEKLLRYLCTTENKSEETTDVVCAIDSMITLFETSAYSPIEGSKPTAPNYIKKLYGDLGENMCATNNVLCMLSSIKRIERVAYPHVYNIVRRLVRLNSLCHSNLHTEDFFILDSVLIGCMYDHLIDIRNYFHFLSIN